MVQRVNHLAASKDAQISLSAEECARGIGWSERSVHQMSKVAIWRLSEVRKKLK